MKNRIVVALGRVGLIAAAVLVFTKQASPSSAVEAFATVHGSTVTNEKINSSCTFAAKQQFAFQMNSQSQMAINRAFFGGTANGDEKATTAKRTDSRAERAHVCCTWRSSRGFTRWS